MIAKKLHNAIWGSSVTSYFKDISVNEERGTKKKGEMCQIIFVVALKKDRQIEKLRKMCGLTNN